MIGYRRANHAALYAHLRTLIASTLAGKDLTIGLHGVAVTELGKFTSISAGGTPELQALLQALAHLQGKVIAQAVARRVGDTKTAEVGDQYDPELGRARCVGCGDGDPSGEHAREELRENGRAWLGLTIAVAMEFYGEHLSDRAKELLSELKAEALPMSAEVS